MMLNFNKLAVPVVVRVISRMLLAVVARRFIPVKKEMITRLVDGVTRGLVKDADPLLDLELDMLRFTLKK